MEKYTLKNVDPEDIDDLLVQVERSFNIKFADKELADVETFGELCDRITNKIELAHTDDCTTQQAFYKLRDAITSVLEMEDISPETQLSTILPRESRIQKIKAIENKLGFKLHILEPKGFIILSLLAILLISFIILFIHWPTGLCGLIISIFGFRIANTTGRELAVQTVGQVAEKMQRENYVKSRRNPGTVNKKEIEKILTDWFSEEFELDKTQLRNERFR